MTDRQDQVSEMRRAPLAMTGRAPRTLDEKTRSVEVTWTTGAAVRRRGRLPDGNFGEYIEELSLDPNHVDLARMNGPDGGAAPVLNSHNNWDLRDVIGRVDSASVDGNIGTARLVFSDRADVEPIFRDVSSGILRNISVGYQVRGWEWIAGDGTSLPRARAISWEPMELSLVPLPADPGAQVRSADSPSSTAALAAISERQMDDTSSTPAVDEAAIRATVTAEANAAADARIQAERERNAGLMTLARKLSLGDEFAQQHITSGSSLDAAREAAFEIVAARQEQTPTHSQRAELVADETDKMLRGMTNAILIRASVAQLVAKDTGEKIDGGEYRGLSLLDMARSLLERGGVRTSGMSRMELVATAFTRPGMLARGALNSTSDFAVLLENTMNKTLLAAYATQPVVYPTFCRVGTVVDFRPTKRYKRGLLGTLVDIAEHGEFQRVVVPDGEKETITAKTKGFIIGLTRQTIINDDMGVFSDLATDAGRAAAVTVENDVFALLALNGNTGPTMGDGTVLFHANHGNIGTTAISSVASFEEIASLMRAQKDPAQKDFIDLRPSVWLGPVAKGFNARVINAAEYDPDTTNKLQKPNSVRGLFDIVVDTPRLTGTRWYALANPAIAAAIEVAFLEGQARPFLDSMQGWDVDGTEWKVRQDYGVAAIDWRAAATNAGA